MKIYPSLISSDLLNLGNTIKLLEDDCDGFHIDIMDDHFVPNLTWGPAFVSAMLSATNLPLHVHLMVGNPAPWVDRISLRSDDLFVFHVESVSTLESIVKLIADVKSRGWLVGLAVNPTTELEKFLHLLPQVDHVLIMSVNPGFSGQEFIPDVVRKIDRPVEIRKEKKLAFSIGIDGGVGLDNIKMLADKGIDCAGVASAIFSKKDFLGELSVLKKAIR